MLSALPRESLPRLSGVRFLCKRARCSTLRFPFTFFFFSSLLFKGMKGRNLSVVEPAFSKISCTTHRHTSSYEFSQHPLLRCLLVSKILQAGPVAHDFTRSPPWCTDRGNIVYFCVYNRFPVCDRIPSTDTELLKFFIEFMMMIKFDQKKP